MSDTAVITNPESLEQPFARDWTAAFQKALTSCVPSKVRTPCAFCKCFDSCEHDSVRTRHNTADALACFNEAGQAALVELSLIGRFNLTDGCVYARNSKRIDDFRARYGKYSSAKHKRSARDVLASTSWSDEELPTTSTSAEVSTAIEEPKYKPTQTCMSIFQRYPGCVPVKLVRAGGLSGVSVKMPNGDLRTVQLDPNLIMETENDIKYALEMFKSESDSKKPNNNSSIIFNTKSDFSNLSFKLPDVDKKLVSSSPFPAFEFMSKPEEKKPETTFKSEDLNKLQQFIDAHSEKKKTEPALPVQPKPSKPSGLPAPSSPTSEPKKPWSEVANTYAEDGSYEDPEVELPPNLGLHTPGYECAVPSSSFVHYRGVWPISKPIRNRLNAFFKDSSIRDGFEILIRADHDQERSTCAYSFNIPDMEPTRPVNYSTFYKMCELISRKLHVRDSKGHQIHLDLEPYIVVKHRINPMFNSKDASKKSDEQALKCKKCGIPFEDGKRHKCETAKKSEAKKEEVKTILKKSDVKKDEAKPSVDKSFKVGDILKESTTASSSTVEPMSLLQSAIKKAVSAKSMAKDAVKSLPGFSSLFDEDSGDGRTEGQENADAVLQDIEARKAPKFNPDEPNEQCAPSKPASFEYDRDVNKKFPFACPRNWAQFSSLIPWELIKFVVKYWIFMFCLASVAWIYRPVSKFLFDVQPSIWSKAYCSVFTCDYWTYLDALSVLIAYCCNVGFVILVVYQFVSFFLTYGTSDVLLSASIKAVKPYAVALSKDDRPFSIKSGDVRITDPAVWEVELVTRIFNCSTNEANDRTGFFVTTRTRKLHVSAALLSEMNSNRVFSENSDLDQVKRNLSNALSNMTAVNVPKSVFDEGIDIFNDTHVYALHRLQRLRPSEDVFRNANK
jgi:hypothetical protein